LIEFKIGENYPSAEQNISHVFKVIRSRRPKIEIWQ